MEFFLGYNPVILTFYQHFQGYIQVANFNTPAGIYK